MFQCLSNQVYVDLFFIFYCKSPVKCTSDDEAERELMLNQIVNRSIPFSTIKSHGMHIDTCVSLKNVLLYLILNLRERNYKNNIRFVQSLFTKNAK